MAPPLLQSLLMNGLHRTHGWLSLTLFASAVAGLGCSSSSPAAGPATETKSDKIRVTSPALQAGDLATLTADNRHFAVDLYQAVRAGSTDNLVFSPASISIALAMTYGGARATTADQMSATLHFSLPPERLHPTFDALDLALEAPPTPGADAGAFQLSLANALWGQKGFPFQSDFLDLLALDYGSGMHVVDFMANAEAARLTINQWVSDQTNAKIPELLAQGVVDDSTRFVLTNAVYFKADWDSPFDANSPPGTFNAPSGPVLVPMMRRGYGTSPTWKGQGYRAATLSYKGGKTSMVVIVPDAGTFDAFEAGLTSAAMDAILSPAAMSDAAFSMPRFKIDTSLKLKDALTAMGMTDAFTAGAADFSGIDGMHDIVLTAVVHKAMIAVDEKGTEAAAATGVVAGVTGGMPIDPLVVDRPFIYAIRDDATGTILFLGRVLDPSK
jgi:serpin B